MSLATESELKALLAPSTTGGFSLLGNLDLEVDDSQEQEPSIPIERQQSRIHPARAAAGAFQPVQARQWGPQPGQGKKDGLFFAYPSAAASMEDGQEKEKAELVRLVGQEKADQLGRETGKRLQAGEGFFRIANEEKMEEEHEKLVEALKGQVRKRHREASKRKGKA